jgi:hypothetical protein
LFADELALRESASVPADDFEVRREKFGGFVEDATSSLCSRDYKNLRISLVRCKSYRENALKEAYSKIHA